MTTAARAGRRMASTNVLTDTLAILTADCNRNAPAVRICPTSCIARHTLLGADDLGPYSRCDECGMTVDLTLWQQAMFAESRPWSRWGRARDAE